MARSKETISKREKEKKTIKTKATNKERKKIVKMKCRKGKSLEEMMAYVDENGNPDG